MTGPGRPPQIPTYEKVLRNYQEKDHILEIYNREKGTQASNITETVRKWYEDAAKAIGWTRVIWSEDNTGYRVNLEKDIP